MHVQRPATLWFRQYRWQALDVPGFELLEIGERKSGIDARGMLISEAEGTGFGASYHVRLAHDWTFQALNLQLLDGRSLKLRSDGKGKWTEGDGAPRPDLCDCVDIDLSGSPFTNTLPIGRTHWQTGVPENFTMAFVDLATLSVTPHSQVYTKLDDTRFSYRSETTGFESELGVDSDGFVTAYPGFFQRVED